MWIWQPFIPGGGPITGTAALSVSQPAIAASGTFTAPPITGDAALSVAQPAIAGSGTFTPLTITGTAALDVPQPQIAGTGTAPISAPPAVGGRPRGRRAVVHRYPPRKPAPFDPADLTVSELASGSASVGVSAPRIRARGTVEAPYESAADDRLVLDVMLEDEDVALVLAMDDAWR